MKRLIILYLFILWVYPGLRAQVIDTSKTINTWRLMHNFTRFEEVELDTNLHQLHREYNPAYEQGFAYESLGMLGHAMNHVDFFQRPDEQSFVFATGWNPYLKTPARTTFFNTKKPFTVLSYSTIPVVDWREENVAALHTQNLTPFTNFGIDFNILAGKELYNNEGTRSNRIGLFYSHAREKYSIFGTFYYNDFKAQDHGGLADIQSFLDDTQERPWLYEMNLQQASSQYRNLSLFITQKYNLLERVTTVDSLGNKSTSGKTVSLSYQLLADRNMKSYKDEINPASLSPIYDTVYYLHNDVKDSASVGRISNVFQVILGDPDYDRLSARVYAGYDLQRYGNLYPRKDRYLLRVDTLGTVPLQLDSVFRDTAIADFHSKFYHDVYVGANLAGPTTGIWDWVISGKYYLTGYYRNNFYLDVTFSRLLAETIDLGIRGSIRSVRPHYFMNHYSSSFFEWDHDFSSIYTIKGEAFVNSRNRDLDIRLGAAYISNYTYWDEHAMPAQYNKDLLILSGYFYRHFILSGYHSENKVLVQYTTAPEVLRLPLVALYTSNYWEQSLFKGALVTNLGFDVYYTTPYKASAYMPPTGVFYLQNQGDVGGYPFLSAFLSFRIARTRIFASYNNILKGVWFADNHYFTTYAYPMKPRYFRLGLVWTFYD